MTAEYHYDANYPYLKYISDRVKDPIRIIYDSVILYSTILKPLQLKSGQTLLDVGSCIGRVANFLKAFGIKTYGIDINFQALKNGVELFPNNKSSINGNAIKLPFPNKSFDTVMTYDFLEHLKIDKLNLALDEIVRVSKGNLMFHKITVSEDHNINSDESHVIKWSTDKWKDWFLSKGWKVIEPTTKSPLLKPILGNFLMEKI